MTQIAMTMWVVAGKSGSEFGKNEKSTKISNHHPSSLESTLITGHLKSLTKNSA
jgi:hypothetical protein